MFIKRLKCDQCGKEENCEVTYTPDDHTPDYEKPKGWVSFDATPPKEHCDKCLQEIRYQRISPNIGHRWLMTYMKDFCCDECKAEYLKEHPEQAEYEGKQRRSSLGGMGWIS